MNESVALLTTNDCWFTINVVRPQRKATKLSYFNQTILNYVLKTCTVAVRSIWKTNESYTHLIKLSREI